MLRRIAGRVVFGCEVFLALMIAVIVLPCSVAPRASRSARIFKIGAGKSRP